VLLADDVRAKDLAEELQFRLAGGRRPRGDVVDGAVVFAQPDRAVGTERRVGEIALVALDDCELADSIEERGLRA